MEKSEREKRIREQEEAMRKATEAAEALLAKKGGTTSASSASSTSAPAPKAPEAKKPEAKFDTIAAVQEIKQFIENEEAKSGPLSTEKKREIAQEIFLKSKEAFQDSQLDSESFFSKKLLAKTEKWWSKDLDKTRAGRITKVAVSTAIIASATLLAGVGLGIAPPPSGIATRLLSRVGIATGLNMTLTSNKVQEFFNAFKKDGGENEEKKGWRKVVNLQNAAMAGGVGAAFILSGPIIASIAAGGIITKKLTNYMADTMQEIEESNKKNLSYKIDGDNLESGFDINALADNLERISGEYDRIAKATKRIKWGKNIANGILTMGTGLVTMDAFAEAKISGVELSPKETLKNIPVVGEKYNEWFGKPDQIEKTVETFKAFRENTEGNQALVETHYNTIKNIVNEDKKGLFNLDDSDTEKIKALVEDYKKEHSGVGTWLKDVFDVDNKDSDEKSLYDIVREKNNDDPSSLLPKYGYGKDENQGPQELYHNLEADKMVHLLDLMKEVKNGHTEKLEEINEILVKFEEVNSEWNTNIGERNLVYREISKALGISENQLDKLSGKNQFLGKDITPENEELNEKIRELTKDPDWHKDHFDSQKLIDELNKKDIEANPTIPTEDETQTNEEPEKAKQEAQKEAAREKAAAEEKAEAARKTAEAKKEAEEAVKNKQNEDAKEEKEPAKEKTAPKKEETENPLKKKQVDPTTGKPYQQEQQQEEPKNLKEKQIDPTTGKKYESSDAGEKTAPAFETKAVASNVKINVDTVVHQGEGVEHPLARQIASNPVLAKQLGYEGAPNDQEALRIFAGKEAHILAKENDLDKLIIKEADKTAFKIEVKNGEISVAQEAVKWPPEQILSGEANLTNETNEKDYLPKSKEWEEIKENNAKAFYQDGLEGKLTGEDLEIYNKLHDEFLNAAYHNKIYISEMEDMTVEEALVKSYEANHPTENIQVNQKDLADTQAIEKESEQENVEKVEEIAKTEKIIKENHDNIINKVFQKTFSSKEGIETSLWQEKTKDMEMLKFIDEKTELTNKQEDFLKIIRGLAYEAGSKAPEAEEGMTVDDYFNKLMLVLNKQGINAQEKTEEILYANK